jgi:hypothetical protein
MGARATDRRGHQHRHGKLDAGLTFIPAPGGIPTAAIPCEKYHARHSRHTYPNE